MRRSTGMSLSVVAYAVMLGFMVYRIVDVAFCIFSDST